MLVLSGLLIAGYGNYNNSQSVVQAASTVISNLGNARTNAKFGVKPFGCDSLVGYEVDFSTDNKTYTTRPVCMVSGVQQEVGALQAYTLSGGVTFSSHPSFFIFQVLGQGASSAESIILSGNNNTATVVVSLSGDMWAE